MIQTKTSTSCLSLKQRSFLLLIMRLCLNNIENFSKTTEENLRSSNLLCFPDERKKQGRLKPRRWFAKNVFPDFDCISFFNQPWTVNQGRAVSFKRFTIPWNQCLGAVWSVVVTMDEHFQTRSRHILYSETLLTSTALRLELKHSSLCFSIADKSLYLLNKKHICVIDMMILMITMVLMMASALQQGRSAS